MKNLYCVERARRIVVALVMLLIVTAANAVPAKPGQKRQLTLTDGTTVSALLVGDEHGHYWVDDNGQAYQAADKDGIYRAVDRQAVMKKAQQRRSKANATRVKRLPRRSNMGTFGSYTGEKKGLIILVNFPDKQFKSTNDNELFQSIANEKNYSSGSFKGSMYDYFYDQSGHQFELTFDVVGPVTVDQAMAHYGKNDRDGNDEHPAEMVIEALKLVDKDVNFKEYDWDDDGEVDQVYLIYAGKGEADGGAVNTIWPHAYTLHESKDDMHDGDGPQTLDGVVIDTYACGSELNGQGRIAGIGTMCHEFSHCLGFPDFYDIDYSGGQGMFSWDLMDNGSYNGDGYLPAGYTGYERWMAGWQQPIELTTTKQVDGMLSLQDGGEFYIIYNNGCRDEYYILENRQLTGWDAGLPGRGLLIVHVDYDADVWAGNGPNDDPGHQRMTWIAADNKYQYEMYSGEKYYTEAGAKNDPFPYGKVNAFNKSTTPAAKFYNKNSDGTYYLDTSVENITQNADGTISFLYRGVSNVKAPVFSPVGGRYTEAQSVTISCETEGATIYYTVDGTTPTASSVVYNSPITVAETVTIKAVAIKEGEESAVVSAKYTIGEASTNPDAKTFAAISSVDEVEPDMRYIIACPEKARAAGNELKASGTAAYLVAVEQEFDDGETVIGDDVAVFILESYKDGWALKNEKTGLYLYALDAKKLSYGDDPAAWTLDDSDGCVSLTFGDLGTILFNNNAPRFTTYTSEPNNSMIVAGLCIETDGGTVTPVTKKDVTMSFTPSKVEVTQGETFTEPTLTTDPVGLSVRYKSDNTSVATVDDLTGEVEILAVGTTVITAIFDGNDEYNSGTASYTLTVKKAVSPTTGTFKLVTDVTALTNGDDVLIAYVTDEEAYVMSTTQNTNNRAATTDVTVNVDGSLTPGKTAEVITLEKDGNDFLFHVADGYLFAASSTKNNLRTEETVDDNAKATISIDNQGDATIVFQGENTRNHMRFNPNNGQPMFSCYAETSTIVNMPQIYRLDSLVTGIENVNVNVKGNVNGNFNGKVYDLQGRRVNRTGKGIYIVNGRKFVR